MIVTRTVSDLQKAIHGLSPSGGRPGFVPTMGALHEGHLSLIRRSVAENDVTVSSIFVNPRQFNSREDFDRYPRDEKADRELLKRSGCSVAFIPSDEEVYRGDDEPEFDFGTLVTTMEGRHRPGHFKGMASVVYRFFRMVEPANAYFGEKDFQQLAVIRSLVHQSGLPVRIVSCPTLREPDGLAMSSRNIHLTPAERQSAGAIYRSLQHARDLFSMETPVKAIREKVQDLVGKDGLFRLQYFEIVDETDLQPIEEGGPGNHARAFIAALASRTRLIDNLALS